MTGLEKFFDRKDICPEDIMYIVKTPGTNISEFHLKDGRIETRYVALRDVLKELPSDIFKNINKGIIVNIKYIKYINHHIYHLTNGVVLEGKLKAYKLHQEIKNLI